MNATLTAENTEAEVDETSYWGAELELDFEGDGPPEEGSGHNWVDGWDLADCFHKIANEVRALEQSGHKVVRIQIIGNRD